MNGITLTFVYKKKFVPIDYSKDLSLNFNNGTKFFGSKNMKG